LQLASAYAAIANGGVLMKPFIVKEFRNTNGETISRIAPQMVRRVVSEETAKRVTALLCGVVDHGTGTEARLASYRVAGKTGTSQQLVGGAYSKSKYSASFVGYFPAENPDVVLLVTLDAPRNGYYGGAVAAPVFRQIAQRVASSPSHLRMVDGNVPVMQASTKTSMTPDLRFLSIATAERRAIASGLTLRHSGSGELVVAQDPAAGSPAGSDGIVRVVLSTNATSVGVPDARGLSMRQAVNLFSQQRIPVRVVGSGLVAMQTCPSTTRDTAWTLVGTVQ
jgi:membrane peptidoglycan carboxypeptidase